MELHVLLKGKDPEAGTKGSSEASDPSSKFRPELQTPQRRECGIDPTFWQDIPSDVV